MPKAAWQINGPAGVRSGAPECTSRHGSQPAPGLTGADTLREASRRCRGGGHTKTAPASEVTGYTARQLDKAIVTAPASEASRHPPGRASRKQTPDHAGLKKPGELSQQHPAPQLNMGNLGSTTQCHGAGQGRNDISFAAQPPAGLGARLSSVAAPCCLRDLSPPHYTVVPPSKEVKCQTGPVTTT